MGADKKAGLSIFWAQKIRGVTSPGTVGRDAAGRATTGNRSGQRHQVARQRFFFSSQFKKACRIEMNMTDVSKC